MTACTLHVTDAAVVSHGGGSSRIFSAPRVVRSGDTQGNAGNASFAVNRPQYRQRAAVDARKKVFAFFEKQLT